MINDMSEQGNVGLGGDGDEIAALEDVEAAFGVRLDYSTAGDWTTVGDVWIALAKQLPDGASDRPETWTRFAEALCSETGMDPKRINLESGLIAENGLWVQVANVSAFVWVASAVGMLVLMAWALL